MGDRKPGLCAVLVPGAPCVVVRGGERRNGLQWTTNHMKANKRTGSNIGFVCIEGTSPTPSYECHCTALLCLAVLVERTGRRRAVERRCTRIRT